MVSLARKLAFTALDNFEKKHVYLFDTFEQEKRRASIDPKDLSLAYEIACGTCRMRRFLDETAKKMADSLPEKRVEKILLRMALYESIFLNDVPLYATVNEYVALAKQLSHSSFASFLNAVLRKDKTGSFLPLYSYPDFFIQTLIAQYGKDTAKKILDAGNTGSSLTARLRGKIPIEMIEIETSDLSLIGSSKDYYIQNRSQPTLYSYLFTAMKVHPKTILDMCAAPGGKTALLADFFPHAELTANDLKTDVLEKNIQKYEIQASIISKDATSDSFEGLFDLIIVDAPCSNSGVLYKCPEARWRLDEKEIKNHQEKQKKLLLNAVKHLSTDGMIWYSTCSILSSENEDIVRFGEEMLGLQKVEERIILPSGDFNGGFACSFKKCKKSILIK